MAYRGLADLVAIVHLAFILFALFGGLLVLRWRRIAWAHLPAVAWGAAIEWMGWICPLTPLENALRRAGGREAYSGDFVGRYLLPVIYPEGLTREGQRLLGIGLVAINVMIYVVVWRRARAAAAAAPR